MLEYFFFVFSGYHFPRVTDFPGNFDSGHNTKNDNFPFFISRGDCIVLVERGGKDLTLA